MPHRVKTSKETTDRTTLFFGVAVVLSVAVFALDITAPPKSLWTLYVFPLLAVARMSGSFFPLALAGFCTILALLALHLSPAGISWNYTALDRFFGMTAGWVFVLITIQRNRAAHELRQQKRHLEEEVKKRMIEVAERAKAEQALVREIQERKQLEEQLWQAQKMESLGTLAGGVAHDFNNMLGIIAGYAELSLDDVDQTGEVRQNLERVLKAARRGKDLVHQILAFSRKTPQNRRKIHLAPLLEETYALLRGTLPANIVIDLHIETPSDQMIADPSQIQQVLLNLASNAADVMQETGGNFTITLSEVVLALDDPSPEPGMSPGHYLKLRAEDTGEGMTAQTRRRIFEPFFTTKEVGKGTGLGLSVVYGIVKSHGGAITVESAPGKGSIFTIFLPSGTSDAVVETEQDEIARPGSGRVLFIDDEAELAFVMRSMLERLGYDVTLICNPREAWETFIAADSAFDVVITDQAMPGMTGVALAKKMLEIRRETPIILCTSYSETVSADEARAIGIRAFLTKPVTRKELSETLHRVLSAGKGEG